LLPSEERISVIISDETLKEMLADGRITIEPLEPYQIQPASVDLRLGNHFLKIDENSLESLSLDSELPYIEIRREQIIIPPASFLLATTVERVRIPPNVTAFVEGRSSIGRMGLFIQNAGWVDPGFEGNITLELFNANRLPIRLTAGRRICQIVFAFMDRETRTPYKGKYQHQKEAVGSRVFRDTERSGQP
jgi:dCTP deaminase